MDPSGIYLVRYGELALKKRNRDYFVRALARNLRLRLAHIEGRIEILHKKMIIQCPAPAEQVRNVVSTVFGIVSVSPIWKTSHDLDAIKELAWDLVKPHADSGKSFAVRAKRSVKTYPLESPEIQREVAQSLFARGLNLKVDLKNPDLCLGISVQIQETWLYLETWPGLGGMPVLPENRHGLLLSGGLDSPVAGHLIQKRGGHVEPIYFHTPPYTVEAAKDKVVSLAELLARYQNHLTLHVVNFSQIMKILVAECELSYLVILSRRFMMRIACAILERTGGKSIVSGESLGQVASQTIENIAAIGENSTLPILRPLIGLDKVEIIALAKKMGSHDISVMPYQDCCSVFSPDNPVTKSSIRKIHHIETQLDIPTLVDECLALTEDISITPQFENL